MTNSVKSSPKRQNRSLFGPFVLIAIGVYFLLRNMGIVPGDLNWGAVFQLWPLMLVFLGINLLVQQLPRPVGPMLSGLLGVVAVLFFGYILLFGGSSTILGRFGVTANEETGWQRAPVVFGRDDVETAVVHIEFDNPQAELFALSDSNALIDGEVSYLGELDFRTERNGSEADVFLRTRSDTFSWLNPSNWGGDGANKWRIGLSPAVPTDLTLDVGNGATDLNMSKLELTELDIDGGNGSSTITLPGGEYDVEVNAGNGSTKMYLAENGRQTIDIDGDNGSITVYIPATVAARVEFDEGNGGVHVDERFVLVSGDDEDGVWETADYSSATNRVELIIDGGNGSVRVREP